MEACITYPVTLAVGMAIGWMIANWPSPEPPAPDTPPQAEPKLFRPANQPGPPPS